MQVKLLFINSDTHYFIQVPTNIDTDLRKHLEDRKSGALKDDKIFDLLLKIKTSLDKTEKMKIGSQLNKVVKDLKTIFGRVPNNTERATANLRLTCNFIQFKRNATK